MKKIILACLALFMLSSFSARLNAQTENVTSCIAVAEAVPLAQQTDPYNYFKVVVTLDQTYNQDVTVTGYIYNAGFPNTNHPYNLTVTSGELTAATSNTFYETSTSNAEVNIKSIFPYFVSKNSTSYTTQIECRNFNPSDTGIALAYIDSLRNTNIFLNNLIVPNNISEAFGFIDYLSNNGVSATATEYGVAEEDVIKYQAKVSAARNILTEFVSTKYGPIDTITDAQGNDLISYLGLSRIASLAASGGTQRAVDLCWPVWMTCAIGVDAAMISGMSGCVLRYIFGGSAACRERLTYAYGIAMGICDAVYEGCSGHAL
jgi:hypothetical protein